MHTEIQGIKLLHHVIKIGKIYIYMYMCTRYMHEILHQLKAYTSTQYNVYELQELHECTHEHPNAHFCHIYDILCI